MQPSRPSRTFWTTGRPRGMPLREEWRRDEGDAAHRIMLANERQLVLEERIRRKKSMGRFVYRPVVETQERGFGVQARTRSWWDPGEPARIAWRLEGGRGL